MKRTPHCKPCLVILVTMLVLTIPALSSDHADPIDLPVLTLFDDGVPTEEAASKLSGGITDLFVFPLLEDGKIADFSSSDRKDPALTPEERSQIKSLAVILCVRRALTKSQPLDLSPYTYAVHMDLRSPVAFRNDAEQARYGGAVVKPEGLNADVSFEFQLNDDTSLKERRVKNAKGFLKNIENVHVYDDGALKGKMAEAGKAPNDLHLYTGFRDDPFIFPPFFKTNTIAMVMTIPIECFPQGQQDWVVWATSSKNGKQFDHSGRSLRTQQPRFELLNTLPPSKHVAALREEEANPSLMRDLGNKFTLQQLFSYRAWDFVPDVMIYSTRFGVGFPNGRRLTDDVSALLARNGDTLLYELSYRSPDWPRKTTNDKPFLNEFPFLAEPWPDKEPIPGPKLSARNKVKLGFILVGVGLMLLLAVFGAVALFRKLFVKVPIQA